MGDAHHCSGPRLRNDLYSVEWDFKLYYTIPNTMHLRAVWREYEVAIILCIGYTLGALSLINGNRLRRRHTL